MRRVVPAVLVATLALTGCGHSPVSRATLRSAPRAVGPLTVPVDGDRVEGTARVVQVPGQPARFCGEELVAAVGYAPGYEPAPADCPQGVDVTGLDLRTVPGHVEKDGAVEAFGTMTGTWRGGHVEVEQLSAPASPSPGEPSQEAVPCAPPAGGWPTGPANSNLWPVMQQVLSRLPELQPETRVELLRPSVTQTLVGAIALDDTDRARIEQVLQDIAPDRHCVAVSRYSPAELAAAKAEQWRALPHVTQDSGTTIHDLQWQVQVSAVAVTQQLADAVARHPEGLVQVEPDLRITTAGAPATTSSAGS